MRWPSGDQAGDPSHASLSVRRVAGTRSAVGSGVGVVVGSRVAGNGSAVGSGVGVAVGSGVGVAVGCGVGVGVGVVVGSRVAGSGSAVGSGVGVAVGSGVGVAVSCGVGVGVGVVVGSRVAGAGSAVGSGVRSSAARSDGRSSSVDSVDASPPQADRAANMLASSAVTKIALTGINGFTFVLPAFPHPTVTSSRQPAIQG